MAVKTYAKNEDYQLSKNFKSSEFDCHGSGCCLLTTIDDKLVKYLQLIRDYFNKPVNISSGYRCPTHNKNIGGATGSRHSKGQAADIYINGVAPIEIAKYAESIGIKGIGLYETSADGHFTHIDTRTSKSFWYGQNEQPRTTFGGSSGSTTITTDTTSYSETTVSLRDEGPVVKEIQQMLSELGYDLSSGPNDKTKGIDGIFGMKTWKAVLDFQRKNNLEADGIVGEKTMTALEKATSKAGYTVKVTASLLNVRSGPGIENSVVGMVRKNATYKLLEIKDGWGRISSPAGWVSLSYVIAI